MQDLKRVVLLFKGARGTRGRALTSINGLINLASEGLSLSFASTSIADTEEKTTENHIKLRRCLLKSAVE